MYRQGGEEMQFYPWVYAVVGLIGGYWIRATKEAIEKRIEQTDPVYRKSRPQRGNAVRRQSKTLYKNNITERGKKQEEWQTVGKERNGHVL